MAKIIAVCNHKGGVGKTTTTISIGAGMARLGHKVLLVDLDAQSNLTDCLRIPDTAGTIYDALKNGTQAEPIEAPQAHVHVIPSTLDLASAEMELNGIVGREYLLKETLAQLAPSYDYILIDTAPNLGLLTINAFCAADCVLIPMQPEYMALKGIAKLTQVIANVQKRINPGLRIGGIIITQYDSRTTLHRQAMESIRQHYGDAVINTPIRNNIALAEAPAKGMDIYSYAPDSAGAKDYEEATAELLRNMQ